jgi:hypothetical protein
MSRSTGLDGNIRRLTNKRTAQVAYSCFVGKDSCMRASVRLGRIASGTPGGGLVMGVRDVIGWQNFNRLLSRRKNRWKLGIDIDQPTAHDDILRDIATLPMDWHGAGVCMSPPLRAMTILGGEPLYSAETGCGLSTLLMSHISQHHTVFLHRRYRWGQQPDESARVVPPEARSR